jgi:hypothetical protein
MQQTVGEMLVVHRIGEVLGFETETGVPGIGVPVTRDI